MHCVSDNVRDATIKVINKENNEGNNGNSDEHDDCTLSQLASTANIANSVVESNLPAPVSLQGRHVYLGNGNP